MDDLTIVYLTCNELPADWDKYQQQVLIAAVGDTPIISMSMKPMDLGMNILQDRPKSLSNIYWQILRAAKIVTTEYIAIAECDTLYCSDHFHYRPKKGVFAYNLSHWSLFTWGEPMFCWRNRRGNYSLIAHTKDVVEALEERFQKYPDGTPDRDTGEIGRNKIEKTLGLKKRKSVDFSTNTPIINFNHVYAMDDRQRRRHKSHGTLRAYDIPHWGKAVDLVKKFK